MAALGGTLAAFVASSDTVTKKVSASSLGIAIQQKEWSAEHGKVETSEDGLTFSGGVPGVKANGGVKVKNTESQDAYIRVAVYRSWTEEGEKITDDAFDVTEIEYGWDTDASKKWIKVEDEEDPETTYFYYTEPVKAKASTENVMDYFTILKRTMKENQNQYMDKGVKLEFEAEGIQTMSAEDAMLAEWGVVAEINENGVLTAVTEQ